MLRENMLGRGGGGGGCPPGPLMLRICSVILDDFANKISLYIKLKLSFLYIV